MKGKEATVKMYTKRRTMTNDRKRLMAIQTSNIFHAKTESLTSIALEFRYLVFINPTETCFSCHERSAVLTNIPSGSV